MHALLAQGKLLSRGIDEHAEEASPKVGPRGFADAANRLYDGDVAPRDVQDLRHLLRRRRAPVITTPTN